MADLERRNCVNTQEKTTSIGVDNSISTEEGHTINISDTYTGHLGAISRWLEGYGIESRGFQHVLPQERSKQSIWSLCLTWYVSTFESPNYPDFPQSIRRSDNIYVHDWLSRAVSVQSYI